MGISGDMPQSSVSQEDQAGELCGNACASTHVLNVAGRSQHSFTTIPIDSTLCPSVSLCPSSVTLCPCVSQSAVSSTQNQGLEGQATRSCEQAAPFPDFPNVPTCGVAFPSPASRCDVTRFPLSVIGAVPSTNVKVLGDQSLEPSGNATVSSHSLICGKSVENFRPAELNSVEAGLSATSVFQDKVQQSQNEPEEEAMETETCCNNSNFSPYNASNSKLLIQPELTTSSVSEEIFRPFDPIGNLSLRSVPSNASNFSLPSLPEDQFGLNVDNVPSLTEFQTNLLDMPEIPFDDFERVWQTSGLNIFGPFYNFQSFDYLRDPNILSFEMYPQRRPTYFYQSANPNISAQSRAAEHPRHYLSKENDRSHLFRSNPRRFLEERRRKNRNSSGRGNYRMEG